MKYIFTLLLLGSLSFSFAQDLNWIKEHPLNDNGYHFGDNVSVDQFGNIYTSSMYRPDPNDPQASQTPQGSFIRKYRKSGELVWEVFNVGAEVWGSSADEAGNLYLGGRFFKSMNGSCIANGDSGKWSGFAARLDSNGNCLWSKEIKGVYAMRIRSSKSGDAVYITGAMTNHYASFGCYNFQEQTYQYLAKYDNQGNCLWLQPIWNYGYVSNIEAKDSLVAITGQYNLKAYFDYDSSYVMGNNEDIWNVYTALYDLNGNIKWAKSTAVPVYDSHSNSITIDNKKNVYVIGDANYHTVIAGQSYTMTGMDIFLVKYNEAGDTVCTRVLKGLHSEEGRAIYADKNGLYISGTSYGKLHILDTTITPNKVFFFIAKVNFDLTHTEWVKVYTSTGAHCEIFQITSDNDNNITACGDYDMDLTGDGVSLTYNNFNYKKPFVMSIKELNPVLVSIGEQKSNQIDFVIYPNPTNSILNLSSTKNFPGERELRVTDILGQCIFSKMCSSSTDGLSEQIDLSSHPKGIFFIEISTEKGREVRKVVLE